MKDGKVTTVVDPLTPAGLALYREAFSRYKARALWNIRVLQEPTAADALVVASQLRIEGDMPARFLAEQIERLCSASI